MNPEQQRHPTGIREYLWYALVLVAALWLFGLVMVLYLFSFPET